MKMYFAGTLRTVVFIEAKETIKICINFLVIVVSSAKEMGGKWKTAQSFTDAFPFVEMHL